MTALVLALMMVEDMMVALMGKVYGTAIFCIYERLLFGGAA